MEALQVKDFDEASQCLKEGLKALKIRKQERTSSYLMLMNRLADVTFMQGKYAEAEKYFVVSTKVTQLISKNPQQVFASQRNLMAHYMRTDLDKADDLLRQLQKDADQSQIAAIN